MPASPEAKRLRGPVDIALFLSLPLRYSFGCVGREQHVEILMDGLRNLEYRGYNSAGLGLGLIRWRWKDQDGQGGRPAGRGERIDYKPWWMIHEVTSQRQPIRPLSWKTDCVHLLLSWRRLIGLGLRLALRARRWPSLAYDLKGLGLYTEGHREVAPDLAVKLNGDVGAGGLRLDLFRRQGAHGAVKGLLRQDTGQHVYP